jgi:hypothetical protein
MSGYGGYLFVIDETERAEVIKGYIEEYETFSDAISAIDWQTKQSEIFLLSLNGKDIHYATLVRRGRRVVTQKWKVYFSNFVGFEPAIPIKEIEGRLDLRIKKHFVRASSGTGTRVPPGTWQGLLKVIKDLRPESTHDLERLERLLRLTPEFLKKEGIEIVVHERDAVNLALRMAGFDHSVILKWDSKETQLVPFLRGFKKVTLREDQMLAHDAQVFGDWSSLKQFEVGAVIFQKDGEQLTIMNVNRHKVEETLGVDLLYYHHRYESYVMVQYKRMLNENNELGYRPTDKSYKAELQRMQNLKRMLLGAKSQPPPTLNEYRLNPGIFYFKLCPAVTFDPTSTEMIKGMYAPLDYWEILIKSPAIIGKKGGKRITYENVGRYLNNTFFIELVQGGWIGSKIIQKNVITNVIQEAIEGKKSVILAAKISEGQRGRGSNLYY